MTDRELLNRITVNPEIFGGRAIIRGHRLAVEHVLEMLSASATTEELLRHYPWLEREDIRACLLYAAHVVGDEYVEPVIVGES